MKKMDIVIVASFCDDFSLKDNGRFLYLANMMSDDHEVEIITSSFRHETKSHRRETVNQWSFKITFIEEPGYPKNVCLRRFYSHYIWGLNVAKYLKNRKKPDVVYCAVPTLTGPNLVAKYCERENVRFVIDVQDLWPEAFQMILNLPIISDIVFTPFKAIANGIYKRADAICAVSDTYCERAKKNNHKVLDTTTVFLGTDLSKFDRYASENPVLTKKAEEIWICYAGTLGTSYDIPIVFEAMEMVENPNLRFIIMGEGPLKNEFVQLSRGLNVTFTGRLPYDQMCGVLKNSDIVINPIVGTSAASIINKHADYAACGKPVINTQKSTEYRWLIEVFQMGFNCDTPIEIKEAINELITDQEKRICWGNNARKCAEQMFDRKVSYKKIVDAITNVVTN